MENIKIIINTNLIYHEKYKDFFDDLDEVVIKNKNF